MSALLLIRVLVFAAILRFAGRRWRIPYLEGSVSIVVGIILLQSTRTTSLWRGWHVYAIAVVGLVMLGGGTLNLWRQWTARPAPPAKSS